MIIKVYFPLFFYVVLSSSEDTDSWNGLWFPHSPNEPGVLSSDRSTNICDDANFNIEIDFDPENIIQSYMHLCLEKRTDYQPNAATKPILTEHIVPPAYVPPEICMNETIQYMDDIPTFGAHRPLPARLGEYKYLPVQRWVSNLKFGAVVMIYHPCGNTAQIEQLRTLVHNCLYRHVITPSLLPSPERPLMLIAWGKSLQMSVVDEKTVSTFIRENALKGPTSFNRDNGYEKLLLTEAKLLTTINDDKLCAFLDY